MGVWSLAHYHLDCGAVHSLDLLGFVNCVVLDVGFVGVGLAVGSLVGTVGGGESLPKLRSMNLCMKSKSVEPGVRPGWPPAKPGCRKGGG